MQRAAGLALLLSLAARAFGTDCSAGYTHKKVLTNLKCDWARTDAVSCNTDCCELNTKTCGGLKATLACGTNGYVGDSVGTAAQKEAWANKATTEKTKNTDCCATRAKCSSGAYTCPAGKKQTTTKGATVCTTDAASCAKVTDCCDNNADTCFGQDTAAAITCATGTAKATTSDAWKGLSAKTTAAAANAASAKIACCGAVPTCKSTFYTCPAGKKRDPAATAICKANSFDAAVDCPANAACCVADTSVCGGLTGTCSSKKYAATGLAAVKATAATYEAKCCATKATCASYTCPAGGKKKANSDTTTCTSDASKASCETTCCEADKLTCGGLSVSGGLGCAAGFVDPSTAGNWVTEAAATANKKLTQTAESVKDAWKATAATAANKATVCCVAKAACTNITSVAAVVGSTTPAVVVTTTPAAPALKFSEHKVAVEEDT